MQTILLKVLVKVKVKMNVLMIQLSKRLTLLTHSGSNSKEEHQVGWASKFHSQSSVSFNFLWKSVHDDSSLLFSYHKDGAKELKEAKVL